MGSTTIARSTIATSEALTIALATIVMVWIVRFGLVFASVQIGALSHHLADGSAPMASTMVR